MTLVYHYLFFAMWFGWGCYWWLLSRNVKASTRLESLSSRLLHVLPLVFAMLLLWVEYLPIPLLRDRFIAWAIWQFWTGAALTAAGLFFAVWARHHIGKNWSAIVTLKNEHELIVSGPYALVRHPIYTGLLLAFVGSALARGEWRGVLAVFIAALALWRKLRLEERWMREQFGEQYEAYSQRVSALLPWLL
ncbi:MAG: isoprenylcysteine carboxylmethyltransferase family protein [Rhodocyclales bacterium]|nr:isoprenylcysteine carboxylmethyltransferase family protein [Rhodocyclales bacterium]